MNKPVMLVLVISMFCSLSAQWSESCSSPTLIATTTQQLYTPNVFMAPNNEIYFTWMHRDPVNTSYNLFYLRKYNEQGLPLWTEPLIVCSTSLLGSLEWDMVVDNEGNAVLVFTKFRSITPYVGTNDIYIYKVSPTGAMLWNSIQINDDSSQDINNFYPKLACTTENNIVAAWQRNAVTNSVRVKVLNPNGTIISGCSVTSAIHDYETPKLMASDNGNFLLQYFEDIYDSNIGMDVNTGMYVNKYNANASPVWTSGAVAIQNLGEIVHEYTYLGSYVDLASDMVGGMFLGWSDDRDDNNERNAYVQHIRTDGSLAFAPNGTLLSSHTMYSQGDVKICFDAESGNLYAFASVDNNVWHMPMQLVAQKFDVLGQAQWGETGLYFLQNNTSQVVSLKAILLQGNLCMIYDWLVGDQPNHSDYIMAMGLNASGASVFQTPEVYICNSYGWKIFINACSNGRFAVLSWSGNTSNTLYAMRLNANGSLGYQVLEPTGLQAQIMNNTSVHLTWQAAISNLPVIYYKVYQNDIMIAQIPGNQHQYVATHPGLAETTTYNYYVTSKWAFGFESLSSNEVTITITENEDTVNPPAILSLSAYPNPFFDNVSLLITRNDSKSPVHLDIFNTKGQLKRSFELSPETTEFSWDGKDQLGTELGTGIYLVKLRQGSEHTIRKVIKSR